MYRQNTICMYFRSSPSYNHLCFVPESLSHHPPPPAPLPAPQSAPSNPQLDSMIVETVAKLESDLKQQRKKLMSEIDKLKKDKKKLAEEISVSRPHIKQLEAKVTEVREAAMFR